MASDILGSGWNISPQGLNLITADSTIKDKSIILRNALNSDLKEIGSPVLSKELSKSNISQIVLQIQKIRNISAPKANENSQAAPRMLKLVLTDGDTYVQAVEVSSIPAINYDKTPPGSKLLIISAPISSGYILLNSKNCSLLGGQVPALYEKWILAKSVQHHTRQTSSSDGPPAWVNFGCKISADIQDRQFKSLDNKNKDCAKENSEFELQRQGAIAEATSGAIKKVFGGGTKQAVQNSVDPNYKKTNDFHNKDYNNREEKRNSRVRNNNVKEIEEKPLKPSERVSLFDFLEDKLPVNDGASVFTQNEIVKPNLNNKQNFNNNIRTSQSNQYYQPNNKGRNNYTTKQPYQKYESNWNSVPKYESNRNSVPKFENNKNKSSYNPPEQSSAKQNVVNDLGNSLEKMSLNNSQFASRSLRQHLNLGPTKRSDNVEKSPNTWNWKIGDDCLAKYWEDEKYYNANITAITEKTCVVRFKGYGNIEEILKTDCLPISSEESFKKPHTGSMEFRRSAKPYKKK